MNSIEALRDSHEHSRYRIAYRVYRFIQAMESRSYSMVEIATILNVSAKTANRMRRELEKMGIPFFEESRGRWRILK